MANNLNIAFRRESIVKNDITVLEEKGKTYGNSWKQRGGVGAFMMLARKWDRLENQCKAKGYDVFDCDADEKDGMLDDIADLRRYLILVEEEILNVAEEKELIKHDPQADKEVIRRSLYQIQLDLTKKEGDISSNNPYANIVSDT